MIEDALKAFNWVTGRIDSAAKWIKKNARKNEINKIDNAVDSGNDVDIAARLRKLKKSTEDRNA